MVADGRSGAESRAQIRADNRRGLRCGLAALCLGWVGPVSAQGTGLAGPEWAYPVQPGDTLVDIAARHLDPAVEWPRLARLNQLDRPRRLQPGRLLRIPLAWLRHDPQRAEVVHLRGDVQRIAGGQSTPLALGDRLRPGDRVETGPSASATLRFADGSRLLLTPGSLLRIDQAGQHADSHSVITRLGVQRGSTEIRVDPRAAEGRRFEISTPIVNLGVRGTEFRTHAGVDDTRIEVLSGRVAAGEDVNVDAGFGSVARPGAPVSAPVRLAAAPDLSAVPGRIEQAPLLLEWAAVAGVQGYRAQLWSAGPQGELLLDGHFALPAAAWPQLPDGHYQLRVRVVDGQGLEGLDARAPLQLATQPAPPELLQPAPGARERQGTVTLRWAASSSPVGYRLQVARLADFSAPEIDQDLGLQTATTLALVPGVYHWRVAGRLAQGERGPFGAARSFSLQPPPAAPQADPPRASRQGVAWRWQAVAQAQRYQVQAAHEASFADPMQDRLVDGLQVLLPLVEPGRFALRLRAIEADGVAGPFGDIHWVDVPPPAPGRGLVGRRAP